MIQGPSARLGKTGLEVCRIGIGGGSGLGADDLEYAVSRGVNYLFTSCDLHAAVYMESWPAFRRLGRGRRRDELVIVACSYICDPEKIAGIVMDHLIALKLDHVDVFQWGWVTQANDASELLAAADAQLRTSDPTVLFGERFLIAHQVEHDLQSRGYARYLGISTHDRAIARAALRDPNLDILMVRYNIAHRGAEEEVFPHVDEPAVRPGIVTFNAAHDVSGMLTEPPRALPSSKYVPDHGDLYRFCLDHDRVDVVLTGPRTRSEIDEAIAVLERPKLSAELRAYLCKYGDLHCGRARLASTRVGPY